jgi:hypothetical protein
VEYSRVIRVDPETLKVSFSATIWFGELREIQGDYYESRINVSTELIAARSHISPGSMALLGFSITNVLT